MFFPLILSDGYKTVNFHVINIENIDFKHLFLES
jgi:hypothetical protein